ncbi:hypothetical protein SMIR_40865 (plasmid) [Streptomyces mirabilis]|uniref:hypothetical protein n=1 Tax=Streptomyces mirabilis TaxID=68239 RepID=UPI001BB0CE18|nr:hypothetical protein [Streptomyces mirabilis]QUW85437.1 hypothetical protein SMIR_40865 [Streptomyces mirabilis]
MSFFSHPNSSTPWQAGSDAHRRQAGQPDAGAAPPRRTLPSGRSSPAQQINIVLGLAFLTEHADDVQRSRLAQHAGRSPATVGDCMSFLSDVGLVRAERGRYSVTDHGRAFARQWPKDSARARLLLRPLLQAHWSAQAAARHLADGPLPQEQLAKRLRAGLPGVPLRGMYLVEWLVIGLVLVRDEQLRMHLAPPDGVPPTAGPQAGPGKDTAPEAEAEPPAAPKPDERDERHQERAAGEDLAEGAAGTTLLGLTRREVQALPDARYAAFLEGVLLSLRGALAPPA